MDTLTFFIRILDAVVGCAKAVGLLVVFVLLFFSVRSLPTRLSRMLSRIATVFIFAVVTASSVQHLCLIVLGYSRLVSIFFSLTSGVTLFLVLMSAALCLDGIHRSSVKCSIAVSALSERGCQRCTADVNVHLISSSYLATTPVLLT